MEQQTLPTLVRQGMPDILLLPFLFWNIYTKSNGKITVFTCVKYLHSNAIFHIDILWNWRKLTINSNTINIFLVNGSQVIKV